MNRQDRHIVSKINWDLNYDNRNDVQTLQSIFGAWSKTDMLGEMNVLFNQLCPTDQTWRINRLEIDLGEMLQENIEDELPIKFRNALYDKLLELTYRSGRGNNDLEVLDGNDSLLQLLEQYLISGYLPWSETGVVSINDLFLNQLENNQKPLLLMIMEVGKSVKVRKRIAWQFQEPVIKKLVQLIEPYNADQINVFTTEFITIQEKENIVRSNATDFRKNLWFWVLNHLFDERGTLFNRVDFMQSSIRQMAHHYNMNYQDLFAEIQYAVDKILVAHQVKSDFILTLSLLAKKNQKSSKTKVQNTEKQQFYEVQLHDYFKKGSPKSSDSSKSISWNELIVYLSENEPAKLREIYLDGAHQYQQQLALLNELSVVGLEKLVFALTHNDKSFINKARLLHTWSLSQTGDLKEWYRYIIKAFVKDGVKRKNYDQLLINVLNFLAPNYENVTHESKENLKSGARPVGVSAEEFLESVRLVRTNWLRHQGSNVKTSVADYLNFFLSYEWRFLGLNKNIKELRGNGRLQQILNQRPHEFITFLVGQNYSNLELAELLQYFNESELAGIVRGLIRRTGRDRSTKDGESLIVLFKEASKAKSGWNKEDYIEFLAKCILNVPIGNETLKRFEKHIGQSIKSGSSINFSQISATLMTTPKQKTRLDRDGAVEYSSNRPRSFKAILRGLDTGEISPSAGSEWLQRIRSGSGKNWLSLFESDRNALICRLLPKCSSQTIEVLSASSLDFILRDINSFSSVGLVQRQTMFWNVLLDYKSHQGDENLFIRRLRETILIRLGQSKHGEDTDRELRHKKVYLRVEQGLKQIIEGKSTKRDKSKLLDDLKLLLLRSPKKLSWLLQSIDKNERLLPFFQKHVKPDDFLVNLFSDRRSMGVDIELSINFLRRLIKEKGDSRLLQELSLNLWRFLLNQFDSQGGFGLKWEKLIRSTVSDLIVQKGLKTSDLLALIRTEYLMVDASLLEILSKMNPAFETINPTKAIQNKDLSLMEILESDLGLALIDSLILEGELPIWFDLPSYQNSTGLLKKILEEYPEFFMKALVQTSQFERYSHSAQEYLDSKILKAFLRTALRSKQDLLSHLEKLINCLSHGQYEEGIGERIKFLVLRKILFAVHIGNWSNLETDKIWMELMWDAKLREGISPKNFVKAIEPNEGYLSIGLKLAFERTITNIRKANKEGGQYQKRIESIESRIIPSMKEQKEILTEAIAINNAGLVLANTYIKMLFTRLELLKDDEFVSPDAQNRAVHYLQFIVNGQSLNEEHFLILNKILVGLNMSDPVPDGITMTEEEKSTINGMIEAMISYWPAIGESSVQGFRGNWIVRDGMLREEVDRWVLDVEKRAYDILLNQSPFSFGIIKYPWMDKPIHVNWPY